MKKITLLSCSLLLVGCFQNTPPKAPAPVPPQARGTLYELTFTDINSEKASAQLSVYQKGAQGYTRMALTESLTGFSLQRLGVQSFSVDSAGRRYLQARYKITNNTGRAIEQLTFVPVDTNDADSNPGNNTSQPTVGNTPFKGLKFFDGSDASVKATDITLNQAKKYDLGTDSAINDPDGTPLITGLDVSGLNPTAPDGLTIAQVMNYGYQTSGILPIGGSVNVSFGASYDMAIDENGRFDSRKDPYSFTMLFVMSEDPISSGLTRIHDIQGSTASGDADSPLVSQTVTIEGIVTRDLQQTSELGGFYVQEETADQDSDPNTSEGIFVVCDTACGTVQQGDRVRLTAMVEEVGEALRETRLINVSNLVVMRTGQTLPAPVNVTLSPTLNWEPFEGMLVTTSGVVTDNSELGLGGLVTIADQRSAYFTQVNAPDETGFDTFLKQSAARSVVIDDGSLGLNPASLFGRGGNPLSTTNTLRNGDSATVTGVLGSTESGWGDLERYRLHATAASTTFSGSARPAVPGVGSAGLKTAHFNLGEFFNGDGSGSGFYPAPGANNAAEYQRQTDKLVQALAALDADIIVLTGLEDDFDAAAPALIDLRNSLNAFTPSVGTYAVVGSEPANGTGLGILYRSADLVPQGAAATYSLNGTALAQTFKQTSTNGTFTVVTTELRGRQQMCEVGDDWSSGQEMCAETRQSQAQDLMEWIGTNPTGTTDPDVLLMGNFNAYRQEGPILTVLKGPDGNASSGDDFTAVLNSNEYTSVVWGFTGTLDSAFVSSTLAAQLSGHGVWHINSDEPSVFDYNTEDKPAGVYAADAFRSSPRDPILIGLTLNASNSAPVNLVLSNNTLAENAGSNATVGTLSAQDPDAGDTLTYTLVAGTGDTDNALFTISGTTLQMLASADFENRSSYSVRVRAADQHGAEVEQAFTITITDVNENTAPTDITLSNSSVAENSTPTLTFSTVDSDSGDTFTYSLVSGTGSTDNGLFSLTSAGALTFNSAPNFEVKDTYSLRVQSTDSGNATVQKAFTIQITDVNEAPSALFLTGNTVDENQPSGTTVGNFSNNDVDAGETFSYSLVSGTGSTDNSSFSITGNQLKTAASFDFETKSSYSVRVRVTDGQNHTFEQAFTITVNDVTETAMPSQGALSTGTSAASRPHIIAGPNGLPVLTYHESATGQSQNVYVKRWNGTSWDALGGALDVNATVASNNARLVVDSGNTPYVVWQENSGGTEGTNIFVKKWNGTSWDLLGSALDTTVTNSSSVPAMAMGPNNQPVVTWYESVTGESTNIYVKRWNGTSWVALGGALDTTAALNATNSRIAVDSSNRPIVVWQEQVQGTSPSNYNLKVKRWNGTTWDVLGAELDVSLSNTTNLADIAVGSDDHPVVTWQETVSGITTIYVKKWNGTSWDALGSSLNISGSTSAVSPAVVIKPNGQPLVAWSEGSTGQIYMKEWNGTAWSQIGSSHNLDSARSAANASVTYGSGNVLVLAWQEANASGINTILVSKK
ncbi:ExeM/NucH family extracellular endonuclease [Deinococcus cellulosilyticus]|uniref:Cadherin domain-containing protein n=1 Tax=Deinococcus cellulosilyticus (strain DSM 18568 / NBRC 106333 / KACC 11606 / 5516J-15) TaxID=1223518 RepID=A0A511MYC7_DEIC1|nr:ExeM/NucH family extracellular endonuclease [Deinococcus cellulosilyticus]GEM45569.1 hypothetical protein DC3_12040 [Deinococcus cellulosilyticus NBRC 106333 = KACC 11606]